MITNRFAKLVTTVFTCVSTVACFVPEEFDATLAIDKDRNYKFSYDGTVVFAPSLARMKEVGSLSPSEELAMSQGVGELRKEPGIVSAMYVGRGRFRIQFRESGAMQTGEGAVLERRQVPHRPEWWDPNQWP